MLQNGFAVLRDGLAAERGGFVAKQDGVAPGRRNVVVERSGVAPQRNVLAAEHGQRGHPHQHERRIGQGRRIDDALSTILKSTPNATSLWRRGRSVGGPAGVDQGLVRRVQEGMKQ